jgi:hypothetical protein
MQYQRPRILPHWPTFAPRVQYRRSTGLAGLGDLGDNLVGTSAVPDFISDLKIHIVSKLGDVYGGSILPNTSLAGALNNAVRYRRQAMAGQMPPDAQALWNRWRAVAEPAESDYNIYWVFGECIDTWGEQLLDAANQQLANGVLNDDASSQASYTLMDTTETGTTWFGGTNTTSKLTNGQWSQVFKAAFDAMAKGVTGGVLPFTYLDVICKAMLAEPIQRKFPALTTPPGGIPYSDPRSIAFRAALKQLGWSKVTDLWQQFTLQAWVTSDKQAEAADQTYAAAITALNYISGEKLIEAIQAKVQDYMQSREEAAKAIRDFDEMKAGPLAEYIPADATTAFDKIKSDFSDLDRKVYDTINPVGLWSGGTPGVAGLGGAQLIIGGVILVTLAGFLVWAISLMTATSRSAAAQTKATSESIISTIGEVKASCMRTYQASPKGPDDEKALQDCLNHTEALYKTIPTPPSGGDPLGLKWLALLGIVGIGGYLAYQKFGKKG